MHWEPDVGFDPGSPGSRPGPKAGAKPLRHPGIPDSVVLELCLPFEPYVLADSGESLLGLSREAVSFVTGTSPSKG